jgi:methylated-DNA-[protein]-cysteine S-methyltransferase
MEGANGQVRAYLLTPIGKLVAVLSDHGLRSISMVDETTVSQKVVLIDPSSDPRGEVLRKYLSVYFSGKDPGRLSIPLDLQGLSEHMKVVLAQLSNVGFGDQVTYSGLSERIGSPKGARAVGNAVGANPFLIVVPCHRVLSAGRGGRPGLGGFGAGTEVKKVLLRLEGHKDDILGL